MDWQDIGLVYQSKQHKLKCLEHTWKNSYPKLGRITFPTIEGDIYYPKIEA